MVKFSPDDQNILSCHNDKKIFVWDWKSSNKELEITKKFKNFKFAIYSPDG